MKKNLLSTIFSLLFLSFFPAISNAQTSCGSTFTDLAGPNSNYANNENVTTTICPDNPTDYLTVTFGSFALENNYDFLKVYDGTSSSAPLLATLTGSTIPNAITSSTPGGCLTFVFTSDNSVAYTGWIAYISCNSTQPVSCLAPTQLSISNISNNNVSLSWVENSAANSWEVIALPCGTIPTLTTIGTLAQSNPVAIQNLSSSTCYNIFVRSHCSAVENSSWSTPLVVTTLPEPNIPPTCGGQFFDNGLSTGNYLPSSNQTTVICPTTPGEVVTVTFSSFNTEVNYDALYVYDGNSSNAPQIASSNGAGQVSGGLTGGFWGTTIPGPFTSTAADGCLTFVFKSDTSVNYSGWSASVSCAAPITCPKPDSLYPVQTSIDAVTLTWIENGSATQWEVLILPFDAPEPDNSVSGILTTENGYVFSGLTPEGTYKFYVKSVCSDTDKSDWSNISTLHLFGCVTPTNLSISSIGSYGATISWNPFINNSQYEVLILPAGSAPPTATSVGQTTNTSTYVASGLTPSTIYDVYVRGNCFNNTNSSDWSTLASFITLPMPHPLSTNTTLYSPEQLVNTVLIDNPCISVSNVTSSTGTNFGSVNGIGYFTNNNPSFPISSGIVLSTGNAQNLGGPNTTNLGEGTSNWIGDPQLESIITTATGTVMNSFNATKLEFDFTSLNEFMSFNFLFASEEYGTFQCAYSDAFAFLLTDLETGVTTNLAVVPGTTTPVSVVTIRDMLLNNGCASANSAFFGVDNQNSNAYASATNFNGQTVEMTASSAILPNHPYHIKLVVADRGDAIFDSAVFIESGSFTSGPPQCSDRIQLVSFIDENSNGVKDNNEVNFSYGSFVYQQNNDGNLVNISSPLGTYNLYDSNADNTYDFNYEINSEYSAYYSLSPISYNDINIALGSGTQVLYFPITLTQGYSDVSVSVIPVSQPVPGFNYANKVVYTNLGNTSASGSISFVKDAALTINNVSQSGVVSTVDGFSYDYTNLAPYETRYIYVSMNVPTLPTVAIGQLLANSSSITASSDINVANNSVTNSQAIVSSYDPNDKMESHGSKIKHSDFTDNDYLYYTIRFQNTGTTNAINIKVEDLLDSKIDEESIRMVSASHNYILERINNQLVWRFDYIQLPSHLENEELSKGYVTFKVKLKPGFAVGDIIPNTANIYFDTNPAIITNTFNTEFVTTLSNASFNISNFMLFPNPAKNSVQINLQNTTENLDKIIFYDVLGKTLKEIKSLSDKQAVIDISDLSKGVYMVEIKTENGLKQIKKLVKE